MASRSGTATVLGKRKVQQEYILRLTSSPEPTADESDYELKSISKPTIVNGVLVKDTKKRYKCTFSDCDKAYTKPSRLAEHERTHTGERPFTCDICKKSYFRETHLQAHARTHLPQSARPLACSQPNCDKRFWTPQHLRVHLEWHNGVKLFACTEGDCHEAFAKQNQLRAHICAAHAPTGMKPFRCDHEGCMKSFNTNQHLRAHKKTHDEKRYTCVQGACLSTASNEPLYFPTWSALQDHIRTAHPPECTHESCHGRIFSSQRNLRAHQKLHALRDLEDQMNSSIISEPENGGEPLPKKRRGGEFGRDWKCSVDGCGKDFKSKKALRTHTNVSHLGERDFACLKCEAKYGYKHLLQGHVAKKHPEEDGNSPPESDSNADEVASESVGIIESITGTAYANRGKRIRCPYPNITGVEGDCAGETSAGKECDYTFNRTYDLVRHLRAVHKVGIVR
ncbi:transcription factor iiia [Amanita muscaria]